MTRSKFLLTLSLALLLAGCGNNSIRNPLKSTPKTVLGPLPQLQEHTSAKMLWRQKTTRGASYFSKITPEVASNVVYQADHTGLLVAIDKRNGNKIWRQKTGLPISSGPSLVGERLLVGTKNGEVAAFDPNNGQKLWLAKVPSEVLAPPQGHDSVVLVSTIDGQLTALDLEDGKQLWQYERTAVPNLILRGGSAPAMVDNHAYAGFANGKFVALNLKDGNIDWEKTITTPRGRSELQRMVDIQANPVIVGNDVYVVSYQGHVTALNLESGQVNWQRQLSSYKDMTVDGDALYITDNDFQVWALDRHHGGTLWKQAQLEKRIITAPSLSKDYLVVGDHGGYVHWLRKSDGQLMGRYPIGQRILQKPITEGNVVYVTGADGEMIALSLEPLVGEGV